MTTTTKRNELLARIEQHGRNLLAIFPQAKEQDPVKLCKQLRKIEARANSVALRLCNGPQYREGEDDRITDAILQQVNTLLGNVTAYKPKTGAACGCKRGVQRDNCPSCEGTGRVVDFHAIRNRRPLVPVFVNRDPRGYALKIDDEWMRARQEVRLATDWGGYGILAPDLREEG